MISVKYSSKVLQKAEHNLDQKTEKQEKQIDSVEFLREVDHSIELD